MKAVVCIVVLIGTVLADLAGECDMVGFYQELGCEALPNADNKTMCPEAFSCPALHPDPTVCYFKGGRYSDRMFIPQSLINNPCSQACSCSVGSLGPQFDCAAVDCVESFDTDTQVQCIRVYELDSCCSTGTVCGKDAIDNLKTCEVDGKTYREGETFEPKNTRKSCICTANWNGSIDDPSYCKDINCGIEIHFQNKILGNCAPVFSGNKRSCPIGFKCPSNSTKVVRALNIRTVSTECTFGNLTLSVGDEVTVDEECTKCTCAVPPIVSCIKKNSCDD